MKALLALALAASADAHGAVVNPPPRNAVDKDLAPWSGPVPCSVDKSCPSVETKTGWCPVPGKDGKVSGQNGQSCFWFSNGCGAHPPPTPTAATAALALIRRRALLTLSTWPSAARLARVCTAVGCDTCDGNSRGPIPRCGYEPSKPCPPQKNPTGTGRALGLPYCQLQTGRNKVI